MLKLIKSTDTEKKFKEQKRIVVDLTKVDLDEVSNPVGFLQEFIQKCGSALPLYGLGSEMTSPFSCCVTLPMDGRQTHGFGNKKSEAKMNAAVRMLHLLRDDMVKDTRANLPPVVCPTSPPVYSTTPSSVSDSGNSSSRHPVSLLQEYCQKRKVFAPLYHYYQHTQEGETEFTCVCRLNTYNIEVRETRRNQREARKAAASQMLLVLSNDTFLH